jgi:hypothetical protein
VWWVAVQRRHRHDAERMALACGKRSVGEWTMAVSGASMTFA